VFVDAVGWIERLTRLTGAALRRFSWRTVARSGWAWLAGALFCAAGTSGAFS
jgi:hypothetical protein